MAVRHVGIYSPSLVSSHGQLYAAFSHLLHQATSLLQLLKVIDNIYKNNRLIT
jgi:hypothetical protein